jgi:hypothetical protein
MSDSFFVACLPVVNRDRNCIAVLLGRGGIHIEYSLSLQQVLVFTTQHSLSYLAVSGKTFQQKKS